MHFALGLFHAVAAIPGFGVTNCKRNGRRAADSWLGVVLSSAAAGGTEKKRIITFELLYVNQINGDKQKDGMHSNHDSIRVLRVSAFGARSTCEFHSIQMSIAANEI